MTIDEGYYARVFKAQSEMINVLDKARNYQLAAAYLRMKSSYSKEIGHITINENVSLANYTNLVAGINKIYQEKMAKLVKDFENVVAKDAVLAEAASYFEPDLFKPEDAPKCRISFWDGINVQVTCPGQRLVNGNRVDLVERINNVSNVCGAMNKINFHGDRLYCDAQSLVGYSKLPEDEWIKGFTDHAVEYEYTAPGEAMNSKDSFINSNYSKRLASYSNLANSKFFTQSWTVLAKDREYDSWSVSNGDFANFEVLTYAVNKGGLIWGKDDRDVAVSLACVTSDCIIVGSGKNQAKARWTSMNGLPYKMMTIYFSNGHTYTLYGPYSGTGNSRGFTSWTNAYYYIEHTYSPTRPLPLGDWKDYCTTVPGTTTFLNGILTTTCSPQKWVNGDSKMVTMKTEINVDKQCKLGSEVTVINGKLSCVNSR